MRLVSPRLFLVLALSLATFGCEGKRKQSTDVPPKPAAAKASQTSPPAVHVAEVDDATRKEVTQRIEAWVSAQNTSDFQSYEKLYSQRFTGVKRAGERTFHQDRATWMADRKRMFENPFAVTVRSVSVSSAPGVVIATFEQTWKSDTFQDRGRKQILFVKEAEELQISREEMLSSALEKGDSARSLTLDDAALVTRTVDSLALLLPGVVKLDWVTDHPRYLSNELAARAVSTKALPKNLQALLNDSYEVFDSAGQRCEVTPRGFQVLVRVVPHFGTVQSWEDTFAEQEGRKRVIVAPEARALDMWRMAGAMMSENVTPGLYLGLEMEPSKCGAASWGRKIKTEGPRPWTVRKATEEEERLVVDAATKHEVVVGFDAVARRESPSSPDARWLVGVSRGEVQVVTDEQGKEFVYAPVRGSGGCASENPTSVGLVFRKVGGRVSALEQPVYIDGPLLGAVDVEGDGEPEFVTDTTLVKRTREGFRHVIDHSPLYLECSC